MNRLFQTFACLTLLVASATAQSVNADGTQGPTIQASRSKDGLDLRVTLSPLSQPDGAMILLGSFDGTLASLGQGLPSVLANSSVIALSFTAGEQIEITTRWPLMHVLLQAVEVSFKPFGVATSDVVKVGEAPISADMVAAARQARDDQDNSAPAETLGAPRFYRAMGQ